MLSGKHEDSDLYRIARVYEEAGEWDKAKPLFERYLAANPDEGKDFAEVGSYYLCAAIAPRRRRCSTAPSNSNATTPGPLNASPAPT